MRKHLRIPNPLYWLNPLNIRRAWNDAVEAAVDRRREERIQAIQEAIMEAPAEVPAMAYVALEDERLWRERFGREQKEKARKEVRVRDSLH